MRELTKSVFGCTWAMSIFGLQQMLDIAGGLTGSTDRAARAARSFDSVATVAASELGRGMRSAFDAGNNLQHRVVDLLFGGLTALTPQPCADTVAPNGTASCSQSPPPHAGPKDSNNRCPGPNPFAQKRSGSEVASPSPLSGSRSQGLGAMPST
jgi:hypothetical protein